MKKFGIIVLALAFCAFNYGELKLSDADREKAVDHLSQTRDHLLATLEGLSEEQLHYKASPERWSIAECLEHITLSESNIFEMVNGAVSVTADASKRSEVSMTDEELIKAITDRSFKAKAPEGFQPSGKFDSVEATLEEFKSKREEHIEYIKTTDHDLRNHYSKLPFGTVDALQVVFFMSGHSERHILQMEEVKADPGFPQE